MRVLLRQVPDVADGRCEEAAERTRKDYTVLLAESPDAAEQIAGTYPGPIHLMLTDVVMPGMRGPELAERLLRLRLDLRVLYMSGYTDNAIAHHRFLDAGTAKIS